jgi:hypothetical protein
VTKFLASLVVVVGALPSLAWAGGIVGPEEATVGRLVVLEADVEGATSVSWLLANPPDDDNHQVRGAEVFFSTARAGVYTFVLAAAVDGKVAQYKHVLRVGGALPDPGAPPGGPAGPGVPGPGSPGVPPPRPQSLAEWVTANALTVSDPKRAENARNLSLAYAGVADRIGSAASDPADIVKLQAAVNGAVLRGAQTHWKAFFERLAGKLGSMALVTVEQHKAAWKEISAGLAVVQ